MADRTIEAQIINYNKLIRAEPGVRLINPLIQTDIAFEGSIEVCVNKVVLPFKIEIPFGYPLSFERFSIKFTCTSNEGFLHQNLDGSICLHPLPDDNADRKIKAEFDLLKTWIKDYYILGKKDPHYSYLLVNAKVNSCMMFINEPILPEKGSYGLFQYLPYFHRPVNKTIIYEQFIAITLGNITQKWTNSIQELKVGMTGIWVFIEEEPVVKNRKVVTNWNELENYFSVDSMQYIFKYYREIQESNNKIGELKDYFFYNVGIQNSKCNRV